MTSHSSSIGIEEGGRSGDGLQQQQQQPPRTPDEGGAAGIEGVVPQIN